MLGFAWGRAKKPNDQKDGRIFPNIYILQPFFFGQCPLDTKGFGDSPIGSLDMSPGSAPWCLSKIKCWFLKRAGLRCTINSIQIPTCMLDGNGLPTSEVGFISLGYSWILASKIARAVELGVGERRLLLFMIYCTCTIVHVHEKETTQNVLDSNMPRLESKTHFINVNFKNTSMSLGLELWTILGDLELLSTL